MPRSAADGRMYRRLWMPDLVGLIGSATTAPRVGAADAGGTADEIVVDRSRNIGLAGRWRF